MTMLYEHIIKDSFPIRSTPLGSLYQSGNLKVVLDVKYMCIFFSMRSENLLLFSLHQSFFQESIDFFADSSSNYRLACIEHLQLVKNTAW